MRDEGTRKKDEEDSDVAKANISGTHGPRKSDRIGGFCAVLSAKVQV
jgi:hypothetical protein